MKALRFTTIMLTAVSMSAAMGHLLEMPSKLHYDGALWLKLLQTLYNNFGNVGGPCEVAAAVLSIVLVFMMRGRGAAFRWTVAGAVCMMVADVMFWTLVAPVNATLLPLTPDTLPSDWTRLRDQWEYSHAARAILQLIALGAYVLSLLVEAPGSPARERSER